MGKVRHNSFRSTGYRLVLLICLGLLQAQAQAARSGDLSRWLSDTVRPELTRLLDEHPRYRDRTVEVVSGSGDALSDAVAVVLRSALAAKPGIPLVTGVQAQPAAVASVDDLDCLGDAVADLQLSVQLHQGRSRDNRVSVTLSETGSAAGQAPRLWQWAGRLTRAEHARAKEAGEALAADGSLDAPWSEADMQAAARALSRDFACSLRPAIATRAVLLWPEEAELPPVFRDTVNASRHLLGSYRELALASGQGDYRVSTDMRLFRDDVVQLWLTGQPEVPLRDPVQAVAYFRVPHSGSTPIKAAVLPAPPRGDPADFLGVEMLGARQADRGRSAELRVALRLENRAQWPIAYSLRLSGGHFVHCIARPTYYRHDRYGLLSGTLAPGATEVRDLVVDKLRHVPLPWFGPARCAGSTDLEVFEDYDARGHRVIDYVRWDL
jgi:hypothetical protein